MYVALSAMYMFDVALAVRQSSAKMQTNVALAAPLCISARFVARL